MSHWPGRENIAALGFKLYMSILYDQKEYAVLTLCMVVIVCSRPTVVSEKRDWSDEVTHVLHFCVQIMYSFAGV